MERMTTPPARLRVFVSVLVVLAFVSLFSACEGGIKSQTSGTSGTILLSANKKSLSFGYVAVGSSSPLVVTLTNTGSDSVTVSQAKVTGSGYSVASPSFPFTLAKGESSSLEVVFAPTVAGEISGTVSVVSSAGDSLATVALSGIGVRTLLVVTPATLDFGYIVVGKSSQETVTVQNTGVDSVTVSQIALTGTGLSMSSLTLPAVVASGQSVTFTVTFAPTVTGTVTGSITIASDAANTPSTVSVDGSGINSHTVTLSWVASDSSDVAGYNVYRSTASGGPYTKGNSELIASSSSLSYSDSTVVAGQTYYYVTTAVGTDGAESAYSNEAEVTIPFP